jgi:hypothetical protein
MTVKSNSAEVDGLALATKVVQKRVPFDEALIRAQVGGYLETLIASLNAFAGREYFNLREARDRINRGEAQRALRGNGVPIELPNDFVRVEVDEQGLPVVPEVPEDVQAALPPPPPPTLKEVERELKRLSDKVENLLDQRADVARLLAFIESVKKHRSRPPRPWVGSMVVLAITLFGSMFSFFVIRSAIGAMGSFIIGLFLSFLLFQREYAWYERLQKIEEADNQQRELNSQIQMKRLQQIDWDIREIRSFGKKRFKDVEEFAPEGEKLHKTAFPGIFAEVANYELKDSSTDQD